MKFLKRLQNNIFVQIAKKISLSRMFWLVLSMLFGFLATHVIDDGKIIPDDDPDNLHIILKVIQEMISIAINGQ